MFEKSPIHIICWHLQWITFQSLNSIFQYSLSIYLCLCLCVLWKLIDLIQLDVVFLASSLPFWFNLSLFHFSAFGLIVIVLLISCVLHLVVTAYFFILEILSMDFVSVSFCVCLEREKFHFVKFGNFNFSCEQKYDVGLCVHPGSISLVSFPLWSTYVCCWTMSFGCQRGNYLFLRKVEHFFPWFSDSKTSFSSGIETYFNQARRTIITVNRMIRELYSSRKRELYSVSEQWF